MSKTINAHRRHVLTDAERQAAWHGAAPLPRRYRWPAKAYQKTDEWLFRYNDKGESSRKILGMSHFPWPIYQIQAFIDSRGRRWCYKHQAHRNSFHVHLNRWGVTDGPLGKGGLQKTLDAARVRMGEEAWHKMEYKRSKRNARSKRIAKRGEKKYGGV